MAVRFTELDLINTCITSTGQALLNTAEPNHPQVQLALFLMKNRINTVSSKEWYFNRERGTLAVDVDGFVFVPDTVATFLSDDPFDNFQIRGNRLFDMNNSTYVIGKNVTGKLIRVLPFSEYPLEVQAYIMYDTLLEFSQTYDVDPIKIQIAESNRDEAQLTMNEKETMQSNVNMLDNHTAGTFLSGIRPVSLDTLV